MRLRRDEQHEAWCNQLWQTHTRRGFVGLPFHLDRHPCLNAPGYPWILAALVAYCEVIAPAATGGLMERLERLTGDKPQPQPAPHWRLAYFEDLEAIPLLGWYLADNPPRTGKAIDLIAKRAGLGPYHKRVLALWLDGSDVPAIATEMHRRRPTVEQLLQEVQERLEGLGQNRLEVAS